METVDKLDNLVDYPVGAIVNLQCPEYNGIVSIEDTSRWFRLHIPPCDICVLKLSPRLCHELCCSEFRKDYTGVCFKPIKVRSVDSLDELSLFGVDVPVHVSTKCFYGYVRALPCLDVFNSCAHCAFNSPFTPCAPCCASQREDGEEVYFEKI
ncbi:MAG: hypothetical protein VZR36_10640 [Prevotella sp.]|nr:hypothetical protein [Prevotella sp.]